MDFQGVRAGIVLPGVNVLLQRFTVHRLPAAHNQAGQEGELFWGHFNGLGLTQYLLGLQIERDVAVRQQIIAVPLIAPDKRPHAGLKFCERKGLHQIVICASIEAGNTIFNRIACCQDQHRVSDAAPTPLGEQRRAVFVRQTQIEDHQTVLAALDQGIRLCRGTGTIQSIPFVGKPQRESFLQ